MKKQEIFLILGVVILVLGVCLVIFGIIPKANMPKENGGILDKTPSNIEGSGEVYIEDLGNPITINETKNYNGLKITNFTLKRISDRECEVSATVENKTGEKIGVQNVKLKLYDKAGELKETIGAQINSIEKDGTKTLIALLRRKNIDDITRIEIEKN